MATIAPAAMLVIFLTILAASVQAGTLYTVHQGYAPSDPDALIAIDTISMSETSIGPLDAGFYYGSLAYDSVNDRLFMAGGLESSEDPGGISNANLYLLDRESATTSVIGNYEVTRLLALAYDPGTWMLFGSGMSIPGSLGAGYLYRIDPLTAVSTPIGPTMGVPSCCILYTMTGMTWDTTRDMLVGIVGDFSGISLHSVDTTTGGTTPLLLNGPSGNNGGIAYDPDTDLIWSISVDGELYSFDPSSGYAPTLHRSDLQGSIGLVYISETVPEAQPSILFVAVGAMLLLRSFGNGGAPYVNPTATPRRRSTCERISRWG